VIPSAHRRLSQIVGWSALAVSLAVFAGVPVGYFYTAYRYEAEHLQRSADLAADAVSAYLATHPAIGGEGHPRLEAVVRRTLHHERQSRCDLLGPDGRLVLSVGGQVDGPVLARGAPVAEGRGLVARVEVVESLRRIIVRTSVWAALGLLMALAIAGVLRWLPMRALTRAVADLDASYRMLQGAVREKDGALKKSRELSEAMRHLALHDPLTGLPNRTLFEDRLAHSLLAAHRARAPLAVIMIDLDRFKEVNDTLGHHVGDKLLQQAGERIRGALRRSDTVARLGGDEFGIVLPITAPADASALGRNLCAVLTQPYRVGESQLTAGASCGIAIAPEHGDDPELLLRHADVAMYQAKRSGGGVATYNPREDPHSPARLRRINDLRAALEGRGLSLYYQPKVSLLTRRVEGVEALLRWHHGAQGLIPAADFVPMAEETALIGPLTRWVLEHAVADLARWRAQGLELPVAVNLSAKSLHDQEMLDTLPDLLQRSGVPAGYLTLELTESSVIPDPARAIGTLGRLRDHGVRLSVDDFGTGHSSLAYLKNLPVQELKIDRSFVVGMRRDRHDAAIVRATVDLARNLDMGVVAEGIEDGETLELLRAMGCGQGQGYFLCRPLPGAALLEWLREGFLAGSSPLRTAAAL
jgi:diguanylate cyclase (GGDEF)-like protein